jgi:ComF family protein
MGLSAAGISERIGRAGAVARGFGSALLGLALPPTCIACGSITGAAGGLCGPCWGKLSFISRPYCERTGAPFSHDPDRVFGDGWLSAEALADPPAYDRARAAVTFDDVARGLVHKLKYADRLDLAAPMARLMLQAGTDLMGSAEIIVPVPLHPIRLWRRKFNQAALLARHVAAATALPVEAGALVRRRRTPSQTALGRNARRANVAGAFAVPHGAAHRIEGRRVLLVDDVYTTGATLDACAQVLRRAGAAGVDALTFARVVEFG